MSKKTISALITLVLLCSAAGAWAQTDRPTRTFNLSRSQVDTTEIDLEEVERDVWTPTLEAHKVEVSLTLGFQDLNTPLLSHSQLIYKFTTESKYWGDVELIGSSGAFAPTLRLGYNLTSWFGFETSLNMSVSEYHSNIVNRSSQPNAEGEPVDPVEPELGPFDGERRSVITLGAGVNLVLYPFDIGDPSGRWHPFIFGGPSSNWVDINSSYTADPSHNIENILGAGLRFIADDLISIRLEFSYHMGSVKFEPSDVFDALDEGTRPIAVFEYPEINGVPVEQRVQEFNRLDYNSLRWGLGFTASF